MEWIFLVLSKSRSIDVMNTPAGAYRGCDPKLFEILSYSCYQKSRNLIDEFFRQQSLEGTFYIFIERILETPFHKEEELNSGGIFHPFTPRLIEEMPFVVDIRNRWEEFSYQPKNSNIYAVLKEAVSERIKINDLSLTLNLKDLFYRWKNKHDLTAILCERKGEEYKRYFASFRRRARPEDRAPLDLLYSLTWYPWTINNRKTIEVACPIASKRIFYGGCVFYYQYIEGDREKIEDAAKKLLNKICYEIYLPVFALFHESHFEKELARFLKEVDLNDSLRSLQCNQAKEFIRNSVVFYKIRHMRMNDMSDKVDLLEEVLCKIWEDRFNEMERNNNPDSLTKIKNSLVFERNYYASPGMIDRVIDVLTSNVVASAGALFLPAVLVVGEPGSGKEGISKLFQLSSEEFRFAARVIISCAEYSFSNATKNGRCLIDRLREIYEENQEKAICIYLDELNSLDVTVQGDLLRFFENRELHVRQKGQDQIVEIYNWMIISIMNEDPEVITREGELRKILQDGPFFGQVIGSALYEYFRRIRRLRDDLYYRLKRTAIIKILPLDKRREDVPILFYIAVQNDKEEAKDERPIEIEYGVFDQLMSEAITWPGNVRQLQSLAKESYRLRKTIRKGNKEFSVITTEVLKNALKKDPFLSRLASDST